MLSSDIIIRSILTEKSNLAMEQCKYVFKVLKSANKIEIKKAVEEIFEVKVEKVTTANYLGKKTYR